MFRKSLAACLFICSCVQLRAQALPAGVLGWYNGDWQQGIPSMANWYTSSQQFIRIYDDFVVPDAGWTIVGVFSHHTITPDGVTQASWEIRSGVSAGNGGTVIASGLGAATLTRGAYNYLVQVDGLWVQLPPGRYWLTVSPVTADTHTYLNPTLGTNAVGDPAGNNGGAFLYSPGGINFTPAQSTGQGGTSGDFSLGVLIAPVPPTRDTAWRANLTALAQQMPSNHSLPFPGVSVANFTAAAADLSARVTTLSDAQIRTGIQALVASIGDPHTDVAWPSPRPFQMLPLSFYWFDDGIYITSASEQYRDLLGGKLVAIGSSGLDEVIRRLTPLIAHDNESWLKCVLAANKLTNTDFLLGTGLTTSTAAAQITVQYPPAGRHAAHRQANATFSTDVAPVPPNQFVAMLPAFHGNLPLYRLHPEKHYWATVIDGGATVYFQYNSCTEDPSQPSAEFLAQLNQLLALNTTERLILDMRNNSGGSTSILNPWIDTIRASRFNQPGRLYVIVGRATFSAAMEATNLLRERTSAIFVGEPTGGKPQFLLRRGDFPLPYFGLRVSYSAGTERANDPGPALIPDIPAGVTFRDYMRGTDAALDAILSIPPPQN